MDDGGTSGGLPIKVTCRWRPEGIELHVQQGALRTPEEVTQVGIGPIISPSQTSVGAITFAIAGFQLAYTSETAASCTFEPILVDTVSQSIWGSFRCDEVHSFIGEETCAALVGYFYAENCVTADSP